MSNKNNKNMKKNYFAMAILACGLLTFSACSNDDAVNQEETNVTAGETRNVELTFNFSVNSGEQTRGGRPLYSSEALQQVNAMKVYVFKEADGEYVYSEEINGNNFGFNNSTAQGTESHSYTLTDKLADGTYKFLAVGYEEGYNTTFKALAMTANTTKLSDLLLELNAGQNADEVFSGVSEAVTVSATSTSFNVGVELNRVVAGILGYFKNVPFEIENEGKMVQVKHVLVNVIKKGTSAKLADRTPNGVDESKYTIIDIDMSSYLKDEDNNWYAVPAKTGKVATVENSVLQGAYSLPIAAVTSSNTLEVVLTGDKGTVLKTFKVKDADSYDFAINANHFYSLGQKKTDDDTNGGDPDPDPEPDDNDDPIDLSKDQIITITVNAAWSSIHDLTIE